VQRRLVKHTDHVKILGEGELKKALTVKAHAFSAGAKEKIEKAGGKTALIQTAEGAKDAEIAAQAAARKKTKTDKK
jgi:large subunit ribosomal protein L15